MDDGLVGTLEDACVMNANGEVALIIDRDEGGRAVYTNQLSPEEFAAWRRYPETFFGQIRQEPGPINNPLELYDRLKATFARSTKEKLLQFMGEHGNRFAALTQPELLEVYVQGMVNSVMERAGPQEVPVHIQRMKPPPTSAV